MCLLNVRSKLSQFQSFVYASTFNVFCIPETWLPDYISDCEILPSDFVLYLSSRGGGVLITIKQSLYCSLIPSPSDIEVVSIKLGLTKEIVICCVYVPPDSSPTYVSSLVTYLTSLISSFERCIFVDDFNFPDIDWSYLSNYFCEFIFDCNLSQHLMESTHIKGNILDLVLTSPSVSIREY